MKAHQGVGRRTNARNALAAKGKHMNRPHVELLSEADLRAGIGCETCVMLHLQPVCPALLCITFPEVNADDLLPWQKPQPEQTIKVCMCCVNAAVAGAHVMSVNLKAQAQLN